MSRSESRQLNHQIGLRLDDELHARLIAAARKHGAAPTAMARRLLADALGQESPGALPKPRRGSNRKVSPRVQAAIRFTGQLGALASRLAQVLHQIRQMRKEERLDEARFQKLQAVLSRIEVLLLRIAEALSS